MVVDDVQSPGAAFQSGQTGSFRHLNGTSFYLGKKLGALGDAGAVTSIDAEMTQHLWMLRNYALHQKYCNEVVY